MSNQERTASKQAYAGKQRSASRLAGRALAGAVLLLALSGCVVYDDQPYPVASPVYYGPAYYGPGYGYGYGYAPPAVVVGGGWWHGHGHAWGGRGWR